MGKKIWDKIGTVYKSEGKHSWILSCPKCKKHELYILINQSYGVRYKCQKCRHKFDENQSHLILFDDGWIPIGPNMDLEMDKIKREILGRIYQRETNTFKCVIDVKDGIINYKIKKRR